MLSLSPGRLYFYSSSAVATGGRRSISRNRITRLSKFSSRRKILSTSFSSSVTRAAATTEVASTRTSSSSSPFSLLAWYSKQLDKRPLLTKSITGGLIAGGGDLICQSIVDADKAEDSHHQSFWDCWDGRRSWNFLLLGFAFVAPTSHYWYAALDRKLAPGNSMMSVGKRVLVDQFTWTPVFMVVWLSSLWTLEGTQPLKIPEALAKSLPDVMVANWALWIPAQAVNFYFMPVKFQVLFTNVFELLWNAYLSFAAAGKGAKGDNDDPSETN